jgi:hypothetical protein
MNFTNLLSKAKREKQQIPQVIGTLILFNSTTILDGIRKRWIFGKDPNGGIIGNYSTSAMGREYQAFKVSTNPNANGYVDLTLTGALGRGLKITKRNDKEYEIFSTDSKFGEISNKYGLEQFNLDGEQQNELFEMLTYFALEEYYRNVWGA